MAGITGIVLKKSNKDGSVFLPLFEKMMNSLVFDKKQHSDVFVKNNVLLGVAIPISKSEKNQLITNNNLGIHVFVEGNVYVSDSEKKKICALYNLENSTSSHQILPFLYQLYKNDIVHHISGWYNVAIYDEINNLVSIFNDKLGFLPIYYFENDEVFVFSSKIKTIIESGLVDIIEFDEVSFLEHLFFNYIVSEHTYVKGIFTLEDACLVQVGQAGYKKTKYWDMKSLFNKPKLNKTQSIEAIDNGLNEAIKKLLKNHTNGFNFSLTGGWDSRVVFSYLLNEKIEQMQAYSFGAAKAPDIIVPAEMARCFDVKYQSFILDNEYLEKHFLSSAIDTIILSNGTRSYKRAHYLYAMKALANYSDMALTGIFGDQIFKSGKPSAGAVISKHGIDLIDSKKSTDDIMSNILKETTVFENYSESLKEELRSRIELVKKRLADYNSDGERHFVFRFGINLRKYFGNEVNSYNDFTNHFSPFTDIDFLETFANTKYMISRYEYRNSSLLDKAESSNLYYQIIKRNSPQLLKFDSSRGFSMSDMKTISGMLKVFQSKFIGKKSIDAFNTNDTRLVFRSFLKSNNIEKDQINLNIKEKGFDLDAFYSIQYWFNTATK